MIRALLPIAACVAACAPPPLPDSGTSTSAPDIAITYPVVEDTIASCMVVLVDIGVPGFQLVHTDGGASNVEGQGHYHIIAELGTDSIFTSCYEPWCFLDLTAQHSPDDTGVQPRFDTSGQMRLYATLNANDHSPLLDEDGEAIRSDEVFVNYTTDACDVFSR